jgi:hypothetical protein
MQFIHTGPAAVVSSSRPTSRDAATDHVGREAAHRHFVRTSIRASSFHRFSFYTLIHASRACDHDERSLIYQFLATAPTRWNQAETIVSLTFLLPHAPMHPSPNRADFSQRRISQSFSFQTGNMSHVYSGMACITSRVPT